VRGRTGVPNEDLAVFTTVYPAALPYLPSLLAALARQTDTDFHLLIAVDDVKPETLAPYLAAHGFDAPSRTSVLAAADDATPAEVRQGALEHALPRFDGVVLVDADDLPLPERIEAARAGLLEADVVASAMRLMSEDGTPTGGTFATEPVENWGRLLARSNIVGFGNSAYRADVLATCLPVPRGGRLMDWLVACRALNLGARFALDTTPRTSYRQHGASMAGVRRPFTTDQVSQAAALVSAHYIHLLRPDDARHDLRGEFRTWVEEAARDLDRFVLRVVNEADELWRYVTALNQDPRIYRWWEWLDYRRQRWT